MKVIKKIKKYIDYAETKIVLMFTEKKYFYKAGNITLKYLWQKDENSDRLIVIFSACTRAGLKARYNYVRTLKDVKANKLFILDDISNDGRGCYYLGKWPDFLVSRAVKELLDKIIAETNPKTIFFGGSSKGAYASMYFGTMYDNVKIIMGAPQYRLGFYLTHDAYKDTFDFICGSNDKDTVSKELDLLLADAIDKGTPREVYIHYSDAEHTYEEHIVYFLEKLNEKGYTVKSDVQHYETHGDVSMYFPEFLKGIIEGL